MTAAMTSVFLDRGLAAIASLDRRCRHCGRSLVVRGSSGRRCPVCAPPFPSEAGPCVFPFDAIRRWFPKDLREVSKGTDVGGWQDEMAARLSAMYPALTHHTARQRVLRARGTMLHPYLADAYACALGVHPCEIWPDWFEKAS